MNELTATMPNVVVVPEPALEDWEMRLIRHVRVLRQSGNRARLFLEWQGPALLITKLVPEGRIAIE